MTEVPVRPASTVMLVRDASVGLEVFTLRRVREMAFAGGMTAFPGGGVDPTDADPGVPWIGPAPGWWAGRWAIGADEARARVVAAVRELFEETGILLAGSDAQVVADPELLEDQRQAISAHRTSLAAVLRDAGHSLRADLLRPWARWITPAGQSRRYDTYFFVAALPDGLSARALTTEAFDGSWARPADLQAAADAGEIGVLPPTRTMINDLALASDVASLLATPRSVTPVTPRVVSRDGEVKVLINGVEVASMPAQVFSSVSRPPAPAAPSPAPPAAPSSAPAAAPSSAHAAALSSAQAAVGVSPAAALGVTSAAAVARINSVDDPGITPESRLDDQREPGGGADQPEPHGDDQRESGVRR